MVGDPTHATCDLEVTKRDNYIAQLEAKLERAKEALELFGRPDCDHLHHRKEDRHPSHVPCPVAGKIMEIMRELTDDRP